MKVTKMKLSLHNAVIGIAVILGLAFSSFTLKPTVQNSNAGWEHLGTRKVSYSIDKDVIHVTAAEGKFSKLRLKVTGGNLNLHKMVVTYGNGAQDNIAVKHNFSRGSSTRIIDLQGNKRVIRKVTFWYDTKNRSRKPARMHLFGR